jgi:hypothetical protein
MAVIARIIGLSFESRGRIMRLARFRLRTLMLTVGVVALLVWGAMMGTRSYYYYGLARFYSFEERGWRESAARARGNPSQARFVGAVYGPQMAEYYAPLAEKYRRAMWRPWIPVAPDPHAPGYDQWAEQERRAREVDPDPAAPGIPPSQNQ